jgi:hypothetical protein
VTEDSVAPKLPFYLWTQRWARVLTSCGAVAGVFGEVEILADASGYGILTVPFVLVFLVPLWLFVRATLLHVRVASDGVRVFNLLHTYHLAWDEIDVVEAINQVTGMGPYARIVKTNGDTVTLGASTFAIRGDPTQPLRIAVPLGKALDRQRARSMAPS